MTAKTTTIRTLYVQVDLNGVIFIQILYDIEILHASRDIIATVTTPCCIPGPM